MKTIHIKVTGRVQGVFFRQNTREQALSLGLKGWVKNLPDGSVEIFATGEEINLRPFISWCRKGPSRAVVDKTEVTEVALQLFTSFEIAR